ncbi:pyridoxamine 5'-phosphate oxidase family protein [Halospeciosus flavus]|uniref:Pyridoxamine 5'-phosphate oxidase family protein n=1 Tax=Halospeciosus flavus TaxID=3032283 RepID=A0ABD5Z661_9EURY|nr:pyridoxamine 5'-phosphate oxidase family protein [Halospeciosus flavus]
MTKEEMEQFLREEGTGVLSLTDGTETYAVPMSFGYDGDHLYFQFVYGSESQKMAFVESTGVATFTVSTEEPPRSVIVRGPLEDVPAEEEVVATNAIAENAVLPTLNMIPDRSLNELTLEYYRLLPREQSGRKFGTAFQSKSI